MQDAPSRTVDADRAGLALPDGWPIVPDAKPAGRIPLDFGRRMVAPVSEGPPPPSVALTRCGRGTGTARASGLGRAQTRQRTRTRKDLDRAHRTAQTAAGRPGRRTRDHGPEPQPPRLPRRCGFFLSIRRAQNATNSQLFDKADKPKAERKRTCPPLSYEFGLARACEHSGFPFGLISDSNFQNGGLNERAAVCGVGHLVAAA